MTTALETAFPLAANWMPATVRAKLAEAMIGVFSTPNLSAEDFSIQPYRALAIYGGDGDLEFYAYDATDTTTVDDGGVSCIVVSGRRYKKRIDVIVKDSALSATTDAQPVSPSLGDTYILTAAPSGDDWAGEAKTVATYTARGWIFREPFIGMVVYVEGEASFYHFDASGNWTLGLGTGALPDGSVTPKKLFHPFAILKVIDQRNAPPGGTPTDGTMYQVGTSPTGSFVGHANEIARWNAAGSGAWEFIAPGEGDTIYRLDVEVPYTFRSGAWEPTIAASGVQQVYRYAFSNYSFNNVSGSVNRHSGIDIQSTIGKWLKITVLRLSNANGQNGDVSGSNSYSVGFYADTSVSAIFTINSGTQTGPVGPNLNTSMLTALYQLPDSASHNYNIGFVRTSGSDSGRDFPNVAAEVLIEELIIL